MPKIKQAWEATSWDELQSLISLDEIVKMLAQKERQRIGDKGRNERRRAILAFAKEHPEILPAKLQK